MKRFLFLCSFFISIACFSQTISGTYAIKNVQTGMYIRIKDANKRDGTPIVSYSPVNWKCVTWNFEHHSANTYQLRNLFSSKTLQPAADGLSLEERPIAGDEASQLYEFVPLAKDVYLIKLKGTDLYITPESDKAEINKPIVLKKRMQGKLQEWILIGQNPEI